MKGLIYLWATNLPVITFNLVGVLQDANSAFLNKDQIQLVEPRPLIIVRVRPQKDQKLQHYHILLDNYKGIETLAKNVKPNLVSIQLQQVTVNLASDLYPFMLQINTTSAKSP